MNPLHKAEILNAVKVGPNTQQQREDVVYTLITTILYHFVGDTNALKERTHELIMNLQCLSLTYIRLYKDTFLSFLFKRDDFTMDFWKERFLVGLPSLFAERIRSRLRN